MLISILRRATLLELSKGKRGQKPDWSDSQAPNSWSRWELRTLFCKRVNCGLWRVLDVERIWMGLCWDVMVLVPVSRTDSKGCAEKEQREQVGGSECTYTPKATVAGWRRWGW